MNDVGIHELSISGPTGVVIQRHHYQSNKFDDNELNRKSSGIEDLDDDCMFARSPPANGI